MPRYGALADHSAWPVVTFDPDFRDWLPHSGTENGEGNGHRLEGGAATALWALWEQTSGREAMVGPSVAPHVSSKDLSPAT